jgi:hypothetical protein
MKGKEFDDHIYGGHILPAFLDLAVPVQILKIQAGEVPLRVVSRPDLALILGEYGDDLLYGGGNCAKAATAVVEAIALCAFAPGGLTIFGRHFEATLEPREGAACLNKRKS